MRKRIATLLLLAPLSLNGMWLVCATTPASQSNPASEAAQVAAVASSSAQLHCKESAMCPLEKPEKPAETGAICMLTSDGDGQGMFAIGFILAVPTQTTAVTVPQRIERLRFTTERQYSDPSPRHFTPPPRA